MKLFFELLIVNARFTWNQLLKKYQKTFKLFKQHRYTDYNVIRKHSIKTKTMQEYGITFRELRDGKVGDKFTANANPDDDTYMLDEAEILFVDGRSVFVRVT